MIRYQIILLLLCLAVASASAQQLLSSAGNTVGSAVVASWSIGEPIIGKFINGTTQITAGYHQPQSAPVTAIINEEKVHLKYFPNPVSDYVFIESSRSITQAKAFSINGREIAIITGSDSENQLIIETKDWMSGVYIIQLFHSDKKIPTELRIIKL